MEDDVYFDGDPAVDSRRRHMERVLKGGPTRRWPWIAALVAGGGAWAVWRMMRSRVEGAPADDGLRSGQGRPPESPQIPHR